MTLDGGYKICNGIELANNRGVSSDVLIEREIANLNSEDDVIRQQGISLTKEQIISIYNTAKDNLCPELN